MLERAMGFEPTTSTLGNPQANEPKCLERSSPATSYGEISAFASMVENLRVRARNASIRSSDSVGRHRPPKVVGSAHHRRIDRMTQPGHLEWHGPRCSRARRGTWGDSDDRWRPHKWHTVTASRGCQGVWRKVEESNP